MGNKHTDFSKKVITWIGSSQSLIVHTIFFVSIFIVGFSGIINPDYVFAFTTNILSIEAIYLAIFIQMTINKHSDDLEEVSGDIEELQEDVDEISEDVEEIQKDVEDISEDVEEIQKDVDEIQEDVEEISEDVEEINEEDEEEIKEEEEEKEKFNEIEKTLKLLIQEITELKNQKPIPKKSPNKKVQVK